MVSYSIVRNGESRSFPAAHAFFDNARDGGDVLVYVGSGSGAALAREADHARRVAVLIELADECLGVHTGEARGTEGGNVLGFARFRMGRGDPSNLIELVRQPRTSPEAIGAARAIFEAAGLKVAVCNDVPGRIVNRLIRPYLNAVLRRLDEGLASAEDMDATLRLGLGYPEGPNALLERTGLDAHCDVTQALYECTGDAAYAPARRARVAKQRSDS
jgi:3-hydroxybutyryl-CoA dehydrogenase